jgi:hypothetical protein
MLSAMAMPALAVDITHAHRPPPTGNRYLDWTLSSMQMMHPHDLGDFTPFTDDGAWAAHYLGDPASIYSGLHRRLFSGDGKTAVHRPAFPLSMQTGRMIAWDLGFDKALPGYQVIPDYPSRTRADMQVLIAANVQKADVLPLYYNKAYALVGDQLSTLNAEVAVAAQILHEWVEGSAWSTRKAMGIDEDVLRHYVQAGSLDDLTDYDLTYLADVLRSELSAWRGGRATSEGQREMPTPLRIARVAAAYRTSNDPFYDACNDDGTRNPAKAGNDPEVASPVICFTDATDRAVYRWYRAERARQLAQEPAAFTHFDQVARWIDHFGDIRPLWAGAYRNKALDWSNHAEVVEAQMVATGHPDEADETSFLRLVERANLLICRSSVP